MKKPWIQCCSIYRSRTGTSVFCTRRAGHYGDHRGWRTQWNRKGERVKITLPPREPR